MWYLYFETRKHLSRMHTVRLPTIHVAVAAIRCQSRGWVSQVIYLEGGGVCIYTPGHIHPSPRNDLIPHTCENITFSKLFLSTSLYFSKALLTWEEEYSPLYRVEASIDDRAEGELNCPLRSGMDHKDTVLLGSSFELIGKTTKLGPDDPLASLIGLSLGTVKSLFSSF